MQETCKNCMHAKHRLLYKGSLDQITAHLKELNRKQEAREVRSIKRKLHSEKKYEAGFDYFPTIENAQIFRKRK